MEFNRLILKFIKTYNISTLSVKDKNRVGRLALLPTYQDLPGRGASGVSKGLSGGLLYSCLLSCTFVLYPFFYVLVTSQ